MNKVLRGKSRKINCRSPTIFGHAQARAIKSEFELLMLRHSSHVGADAHVRAWRTTVTTPPLNNEFVVENTFLSSCYSCGLRFQARC